MTSDLYRSPHTRVELCVFTLAEGQLCVLLVRRTEPPQQGKWALEGGLLHTHQDADLEAAAKRVAKDRLHTAVAYLKQQCSVGGPNRDFRGPWTLSVAYRAVINHRFFTPGPVTRADDLQWLPVANLDVMPDIAFDHREIIRRAAADLRREVAALEIPWQLLPSPFTIADLHLLCEQILGERLDRASFRRRVLDRKMLQETGTTKPGTPHRPAQLYRPAG